MTMRALLEDPRSFGRVQVASPGESWRVTMSLQAHVTLTALLTSQPALRSPSYQHEIDDDTRVAAAEWMTRHLYHHPVPRQRWPQFKPALRRRAEEECRSEEETLREATVQAIFVALGERPERRDLPGILNWVRNEVSNKLCEDFIGPKWRRREESLDDYAIGEETGVDESLEASESAVERFVESVASEASFTVRQREVFALWMGDHRSSEIATRLGVPPSTVRVMKHRIRKKLARSFPHSATRCKRFRTPQRI